MVRKNIIRTFACSSAVLCSIFFSCHAGYAYTQGPPSQAPEYVLRMGAPLAGTVSLAAQAPASVSTLAWTFFSLSLLAVVLLVLWACVSSSASLLPKLPGDTTRPTSSSIPTGAFGLPELYDRIFLPPDTATKKNHGVRLKA